MGFDLYGLNPVTMSPDPEISLDEFFNLNEEERQDNIIAVSKYRDENPGVYFRNNVWWWRPLWEYTCRLAFRIFDEDDIKAGSYNDGHEISKDKADIIARRLEDSIVNGFAEKWEKDRNAELDKMELEVCDLCEGTGSRNKPPKTGAGTHMECNACDGKGKRKASATHYPFSVENVREFARFCKHSGGFSIR
tara:strand:+ start:11465 stop:12040 length:576 start_codon:yes stop_codon:yes gene_type:complete